jgi:hypothetical protein
MAKFLVSASERVYYEVEVEADSLAKVRELLATGDVVFGDALDGQDFVVDYIEEVK